MIEIHVGRCDIALVRACGRMVGIALSGIGSDFDELRADRFKVMPVATLRGKRTQQRHASG